MRDAASLTAFSMSLFMIYLSTELSTTDYFLVNLSLKAIKSKRMAQINITSEKLQMTMGVVSLLTTVCAVFLYWLHWHLTTFAQIQDVRAVKVQLMQQFNELMIIQTEQNLRLYERDKANGYTLTPSDVREYEQLKELKKRLITNKTVMIETSKK